MDLLLIRSLLSVAEHGAITEAARALGLSQPALSRRIQQLEEALGAPLLERSQRGVVLTEAGRMAQAEGAVLVERYERLRESVGAHLRHETGTVRVGGGATAVAYLMPPAISRFQKSFPDVVFQVKEAGSREIEADVMDERLEFGIVTTPVHSQEFDIRPLHKDRIVVVAGRDHPLAGRKRLDAKVLNGLNVVGFEAGSAIRQLIDGALRDAGVDVNVTMELRSIPAILELAVSTGNVAFVSELGIRDAGPRIRVLPVRGLRITRELAIVRKRGRPASAAGEAFAKTMMERRGR
jgi:molybdate transport repressor ModE-like protein